MNEKEFIKLCLKNEQYLEILGGGSFGVVYKIEYKGKEYAVKKISKFQIDNNEDDYLKNALQREISILQKMSKFENSVQFYYFFEDENDYILVLELCHSDLKKLLKEKGKFSSSEIKYIMEGLNKPFKYMHNNDFIHRDIKPENIMIKYVDYSKKKFIPKLADYGISRELDHGTASTNVGTPRYMAPEILIGDSDYNDKSDLFSIGVMMYELYFNSFPFSLPFSNNKSEIMKNYNIKKKKDCEDKVLDDLLNKLLIYDANDRISWDNYFNHPFFNINKGVESLNNKLLNLRIYDEKEHQIINFYDNILEKMISQNYFGKELLKNINPAKYISTDECLKYKDSPFFILGILAKYLEKIGVSVLIEKEEIKQRNLDLMEYHKNLFQFICNSYILKNRYLLHFDLDESRIKYLVKNPNERSNFNEQIKKIIMEIYNLNKTEILVTNFKRYKNRYTVVIVIKSNFNKNITKDELMKVFDKMEYLKALIRVDKELIIPVVKLNVSMLFPREDNKINQWAVGEKRGGEDYIPPLGWIKYAIKIDHCFNDKNFDWISHLHKPGEWCIGYCGITGITKKVIQYFENDNDIRHPGKRVGIGVYCPSNPKLLEEFTETINTNGENYRVGFMIRLKPDKIRVSQKNRNIWVVNGNDDELRPYGILIKKI